MAKYENLPGINLELLDGNLRIDEQVSGPVVLVIGTAYSGPSNVQYLSTDSNVAASYFGSDSPLIKKATEVKLGGAKNVIIYRIGGKPASIKNIFGEDSEIRTTAETATAGSDYSVYIGPQPNNPAYACLIAFKGSRIVFSNVPGSEIDNGDISVIGFDSSFSYRVGTPSAPVALKDVASNIVYDTAINYPVSGAPMSTFNITGADGVAGTKINSVYVDEVKVNTGFTFVAGSDGIPDSVEFDTPVEVGKVVLINYERPYVINDVEFQDSDDSINCSWKEYYELVDQALSDLETTYATEIVIDKAILDAPNIADGSTATDKLEYLLKGEVDGEQTYEWSSVKTLYKKGITTTANIAEADVNNNGQAIIAKQFNEVNFAHRLGEFCHTISENERFILGFIGTSMPVSNTTSAVSNWIGTLPQTDINGDTIANGTGLLGNKFMTGAVGRTPGFYKTDSGFPDGNPQSDSNGAIIDLGKFLSVIPAVASIPGISALGTTSGNSNGAGIYAGLVTTISAGNSTTNEILPRVSLPFVIRKTKLNELSGAGYVTFQDKNRGVAVVSGELATGPDSDYDYISTAIIVGSISNRIRTRLDPYIGKGLTEVQVAAMQTAVDAEFQSAVNEGSVVKYYAQVVVQPVQNGAGRVSIPFTIVPPFELRDINSSIKLAYDL